MLLADHGGVERVGTRGERIDRREQTQAGDAARENRRRVEVREGRRRRGVGQVISRHVDRLDRRDRSGLGRGDALLQVAHLGCQRRLVTDGGGHAAQQRGDLGTRLREAEDVVDEQKDVLSAVAEVLRLGQTGQTDAQARSRRLVHLAVDQAGLVDDARLGHLEVQVGAPARGC